MPEPVRIPVEVAEPAPVFDVVARGYRRRQVDRHLAGLEQELAELRWERDEVHARRETQERWTPSFSALGERVVEVLRLAEQEAAALRSAADDDARRVREGATAGLDAHVAERRREVEQARGVAEREVRALETGVRTRRELLEGELEQVRRDGELEVAGRLATAAARAQDLVGQAAREAEQLRAAARAEVTALQRRRDELAAEMVDLSSRLLAVVHRLDRTDVPLDLRAG